MGIKLRLARSIMRTELPYIYCSVRRQLVGQEAAILVYHRVGDTIEHKYSSAIDSIDFEKQIRYLQSKCRIVSLNELLKNVQNKTLSDKLVTITFDDGYKDNYSNVFPILVKFHVPATIFLATGQIDSGNLFWWDKVRYALINTSIKNLDVEELGRYSLHSFDSRKQAYSNILEKLKKFPEEEKLLIMGKITNLLEVNIPNNLGENYYLSWKEIREMSQNGITFGAHTVDHPILTNISFNEAKRQIVESKRRIEEKLDQAVILFSYPNGGRADFNKDIKEIVKGNGFICAVTALPTGLVNPKMDPYELNRMELGWNKETYSFSPDYLR